ncbi:sensor histidine kinase [Agaribacterium haliotis]|uniref:sensor histidine kinase n=1 Tax=Agaribacterium haliotis TaxID=2013869 RepID=UPI000BB531E7|nr:HAMP domain-containing sensor histidine kinase [Agaribacterium haliotis]
MNKNTELDFATVLASSVHDMKNSVAMLLVNVESILERYQPKGPEESQSFKSLHYEASRINGELIQLLSLYRMDHKLLTAQIDEYYLSDMLEEQVARNQLLLDTSDVNLELDVDDALAWYFDVDLVAGVVHNVLLNCIRYTKAKVKISAQEERGWLKISVADDGQGYPDIMLQQPQIMAEYAQLGDGQTHLGLFFAARIAQMHKQADKVGRIELRNNASLGGGEFILYLP